MFRFDRRGILADADLTTLAGHLHPAFPNNMSLRRWLASDAVAPFFQKYSASYLIEHPTSRQPDFAAVMEKVTAGGTHNEPAIPLEHAQTIDKSEFTSVDHAARMVTQLIVHNNESEGEMAWGEENPMEELVWQAYEVGMYLQRLWQAQNVSGTTGGDGVPNEEEAAALGLGQWINR